MLRAHSGMDKALVCNYLLSQGAAVHLLNHIYACGFKRAVDWVMIDHCSHLECALYTPCCGQVEDAGMSNIKNVNEGVKRRHHMMD